MRIYNVLIICLVLGQSFVFSQTETPKSYITFAQTTINFGEITLGETKTIEVSFTNTGDKPLIISDIYTTCGCVTTDFPRNPFMPGKSGAIKISYNATDEGPFDKNVLIYTNAKNKKETINVQGIVLKKK